ncbi:MAG: 2,3,4,5-tetrahydropyridine-2,6-dicarboxylate N-succinyltransferase [Rickettsiaceae bacterium H1]|nr:2,3,4,5-tetrahydropyridine-2,6-dicarboxylate N-succinyltransferase [Rickettsiaceae bacterium H1]
MQQIIENSWDNKSYSSNEAKQAILRVLEKLNTGELKVAEKKPDGSWKVNTWVKKAILLSFRANENVLVNQNSKEIRWFDKVKSKFHNWEEKDFAQTKIRSVPGSFVRQGSFIGQEVVLMPSFVNIGAYVGSGTMVDTWATIGSCAQIGENCHISGGVGIGGVLEPLQNNPVIIEDNCFIGARSEVAEGVIVRKGSVLAMGVYLGASTKIIDRKSGKIYSGEIPEYSVVVPGSTESKNGISLYCAVIVKKVDEKTRAKTSINELLRNRE